MQNLPEGLIYLLVLALVYAANYLFKRFGPKMDPEPQPAELDEGQMAQEPVQAGGAAPSMAAAPALLEPKPASAKPMLKRDPSGQVPRRALMGCKRNKQTAIAMATILGPCRAFEPDGHQAAHER